MACKNCYKYPFCEKSEGANDNRYGGCLDEKKKREMINENENKVELRKMIKEMLED